MAIDSIETLLSVLRRVQLLAPEQVEEVVRELGPLYDDPHDLAEYLVEVEWLTPYQRDALFAGAWNELVIGPYVVLDRLGEGGVSHVYKAWDTARGRVVALKVLRQNVASYLDAARQFERELRVVTRLNHPNVIKTFDAHQVGQMHYFAMEYVEGTDLSNHIKAVGPLPVEQACDYIRQVAQGLQHAHQLGLVHRDIKPANLFLVNPPPPPGTPLPATPRRAEPAVKILDWGLARLLNPSAGPGAPSDSKLRAEVEAEKGALVGTADYIAPEQALDATLVDVRADIYSLGCTFFYLLTGRTPFPGASLMQKLLRHQETEAPPVSSLNPEVPGEISAMIQRMLSKQPEDRYQIPLLVASALRPYCPSAGGFIGSVIRPMNGAVARPSSSPSLSRPASSSSLMPVTRPPGESGMQPRA